MSSYCRKTTENKKPKVVNSRIMILSKHGVFDRKKSKFIKEKEASRSLSSLGIKTPLIEKIIGKVLNLKLVIMLEYENIKTFLQKAMLENSLEKFFVIKKVKNIVPWAYIISDLNGEEIVGTFYEKELQKTNQKEF